MSSIGMLTILRAAAISLVFMVTAGAACAQGLEVAMVTSVQGGVKRTAPQGPQVVEAFTKLKHGDLLALEKQARLQIVYFDNGRQETWRGPGRLEIAKTDSTPFGLPAAEVKTLPAVMVKQIAKTPVLDSQGRAGMLRLRSVSTAADVARVEGEYEKMRAEADARDITPELYLLASLFEMRQFDRVEQALAGLQQIQGGHPDVPAVAAVYTKALQIARSSPGSK